MRYTPHPDLPTKRIKDLALWAGLLAFGLLGASIYAASLLLAKLAGTDGANLLLAFPAFFACLVIQPAASRAEIYLRRRWCIHHGGHLFAPLGEGHKTEVCARCKAVARRTVET